MQKFQDKFLTAKSEKRAWVDLQQLKTLWFNSGTLCNLSCDNCYIESSPVNDALVYLSAVEVNEYMQEIKQENYPTELIAITGGEPFINPEIIAICENILASGLPLLILTNAYRVLKRHQTKILELNQKYPNQLFLRVSLDHYTKDVHEKERGAGTFLKTIESMKWIADNTLQLSIAGRSLLNEAEEVVLMGYQKLMDDNGIELKLKLGDSIVIFPEMVEAEDVPEITTECWDILGVSPEQQMCASERMIVKRKGATSPVVLPCTLLAYDIQFELGTKLKTAEKKVYLNHVFCSKFCVLGGASCSSTK